MINQTVEKVYQKLGKFFVPLVLGLFMLILFASMITSVRQQAVDYKEGQVAEENIRANKTIENEKETEQKRELAEQAVTPEYTYQNDLAETQHDRIEKLFDLIAEANDSVTQSYDTELKKARDANTVAKPTTEERVAAVKKSFEGQSADDVTFFQQFTDRFYEGIVQLTDESFATVKSTSLKLIDEQMGQRIRKSELSTHLQAAKEQLQYLDISTEESQLITILLAQGIVVNDVLNEKRTEDLKDQARQAVQPVMIYQGEIIVREGSQIDASALNKLKLLGMTSSSTSFFPAVALILAILLQTAVLLFLFPNAKRHKARINFLLQYSVLMTFSMICMKFFQIFQTDQLPYIALFFPAAFTPLMLTTFVNRRSGIIGALFQTIFALFIYYDAIGTNFLIIILISYLFSGLTASLIDRKRITEQGWTALFWLVIFPAMMNIVLTIYQGMSFTSGKTWLMLGCGFAGALLSFVLGIGLYPYIELLITDNSMIALNELSNPNHPLLKQLLEEAPGTYHHSLMVANLSANAVALIGGRTTLTRVACYYHDIGKVKHANFFVENLPQGAENPHNFLLPEDSRQIIFGHVIDGAKILEEYHMPQLVIDICKQHHGTTLMKYFYIKAKERNPEVTEAEFRYPGPKPQSREAGIVNIVDSCEAAVRAMDHPSQEKIASFVRSLVKERIDDGQLDESGLTLQEIRILEKSLISGLSSTFHSRIKYPKMKSEAEAMKKEQERRDA